MRKKVTSLLYFLTLSAFITGVGSATTLTFEYSGEQLTIPHSAMGTGSFIFADGLTMVGLSDLTAFSFNQTATLPVSFNNPVEEVSSFSYDLADLTNFSLTFVGGTPATFSLDTLAVAGTNPAIGSVSFDVFDFVGSTGGFGDTLGPVTFFTPEPSGFGLLTFSGLLLGICLAYRRSWGGSQAAPLHTS